MAWSKIDKSDNKPRYIKKFGNLVVLTKDSKGALDSIPEGWEIHETNGRLSLRRER
tara:strand:- start:1243 stop:1410 length:168 start_codon:yes stop_codon:yes gene_type:complete